MGTVNGLTAERMLEIEAQSIVDAELDGDDLVLKRYDETEINVGSVRGPQGIQGPIGEVSEAELSGAIDDEEIARNAAITAALAAHAPPGTIVDYIGLAPPWPWLAMEGQVIDNGQTTYPALWAVLPGPMKAGSTIIMPDTRGRVAVGYSSIDSDFNAIGETGGSKTHTLTNAEMPESTFIKGINTGEDWTVQDNVAGKLTILTEGGGQEFSIQQRYITFLKIIKTS